MTTISYYKIYCNTDSQYEYVWLDASPTVCPVNNTHSVNLSSVGVELEMSENRVKIQEEAIPTGENYMVENFLLEGATGPGVTTNRDFTYPFPISVLEIQLVSEEINKGDEVTLSVGPDTTIGIITANVASGATGAYVSSTVLDNVMLGYYVSLTDGVNEDSCGRVIEVDTVNSWIGFELGPGNSYLSSSPTYVRVTVYVVKNYTVGPAQRYVIGEGKIGGSYVPKNTVIRVGYKNNGVVYKTLSAQVDYLY